MKRVLYLSILFLCLTACASPNPQPTHEAAILQSTDFSSVLATDIPSSQPPALAAWDGSNEPDPGVQPRADAVYWYQNDTINNGKSTNAFDFKLDADYQYAKIWIQNKSGGEITVTAEYDGKEFVDYRVANGDTTTFWVKGNGNIGKY